MSAPVLLMSGTKMSSIPRILAFAGNLISHVWADGSNNMSFAPSG